MHPLTAVPPQFVTYSIDQIAGSQVVLPCVSSHLRDAPMAKTLSTQSIVRKQSTHARQVEAYLLAFAEAYGLERFVQCRTRVTRVEPLPAASTPGSASGGAVSVNGLVSANNGAAPAANGTGPVANGSSPAAGRRWRVTSEPTADGPRLSPVTVVAAPDAAGRSETEDFEAVVVCNGHYSEPRLPPDSGSAL